MLHIVYWVYLACAELIWLQWVLNKAIFLINNWISFFSSIIYWQVNIILVQTNMVLFNIYIRKLLIMLIFNLKVLNSLTILLKVSIFWLIWLHLLIKSILTSNFLRRKPNSSFTALISSLKLSLITTTFLIDY